jgi:hypothetical protein
MSPAEALVSAKTTVRCDPIAACFDGQRGVIRVRDVVAARIIRHAQRSEQFPVALTWSHQDATRLLSNRIDKLDGTAQRRRLFEHARMRHNSEKPAQHKVGNTKRIRIGEDGLQPGMIPIVIGDVLTMRIDQHVHIEKNHSSIVARSAAESFKSTPGRTPPRPKVGS